MDAFPDRTHVRLWIRETARCLYAEEDGESITHVDYDDDQRTHVHAAWAVHRLVRNGVGYVLFQNTSYGRYLCVDAAAADTVQCTYDSAEQENLLFQARSAEDGTDDVFLSNPIVGDWYGEQEEEEEEEELHLHWMVKPIPTRQFPPVLPPPPEPIPPPPVSFNGPVSLRRRGGPAHFVVAVPPQPVLRRRINYVLADDHGNFNPLHWRALQQFEGQSVYNLRRNIAATVGVNDITLCVLGGLNGRWTPLFIDLPPNEITMNIVVLNTGSTAAQELVYSNLDV